MQQIQIDLSRGLYAIFLQRLEELAESNKLITIPFSEVYEKLCRNFSITKLQCREVLFLLNDVGVIEIIQAHGIKLCK